MKIKVAEFHDQNLGRREKKYLKAEFFREKLSHLKEPHNRKGKRLHLYNKPGIETEN